ncbi:MAG: pyridoxamine 5'-phosphate oxidase family protein [Planctomycetota bacterium]
MDESEQQRLLQIFERAPLCFLATSSEGIPNVIPVGFKWVHDGDLLIADVFFKKTRANLEKNPRVALTIATDIPKQGLQIRGTAAVHRTGPDYERVVELLHGAGPPFAAVRVSMTEAYLLDPGADAGHRLL